MDIMLHFGRRGRENLALLKITDLAVTSDADGDRHVYTCCDEQTKNHQEDGDRAHGRMYEIKGNIFIIFISMDIFIVSNY